MSFADASPFVQAVQVLLMLHPLCKQVKLCRCITFCTSSMSFADASPFVQAV